MGVILPMIVWLCYRFHPVRVCKNAQYDFTSKQRLHLSYSFRQIAAVVPH